jgi:hypothetical protein
MFYLDRFDTVDLPLLEARQSISSGESLSPFRQMQDGGGFRVRGTQRSPRAITRIAATGEWVADEPVDIEELGESLYRLRGEAKKLYRRTKGETEQVHWCWAELMRINAENTPDTFLVQPVAPEWTMYSPCWYGDHHGGETWELDSGVELDTGRTLDEAEGDVYTLPSGTLATYEAEVINAGNFHIDNAILRITAGADPITSLVFGTEYPEGRTDADLSFDADIPAGQSLVIDCGARSVKLNGVSVYEDFLIGDDHKLAGWLRLYPGTNTIGFLYTSDDDVTLTMDFSDGME